MYKFSKLYDEIGWNEFSDQSILAFNTILYRENIIPDNLLDVACGTGEFLWLCQEQYDEDLQMSGLDISEEMLETAEEKTDGEVALYHSDMTNFEIDENFDVITCFFDSLNHLNDMEQLEKTFESIYNHLDEAGIFIFDVIVLETVENWDMVDEKEHQNKNINRVIKFDKKNNKLITYIKISEEECDILEEEIEEAVYEYAGIKKTLLKIGFKDIKIYNEDMEAIDKPEGNRIYFSARR